MNRVSVVSGLADLSLAEEAILPRFMPSDRPLPKVSWLTIKNVLSLPDMTDPYANVLELSMSLRRTS